MTRTKPLLTLALLLCLTGKLSACSDDATGSSSSTDGTDSNATADGDSDGDGDSDSDGDSDGDSDSACGEANVDFTAQIPTVVLLIDQSGSMNADFLPDPGTQTRWDVARDALVDPTTGIVAELEDRVRFGMTLYTGDDGDPTLACPFLTSVAPAMNNYDAISAMYFASDYLPNGDTPTGESITAVTGLLLAVNEPGPRVIVLVTDGAPDTCAIPDPANADEQAITDAFTVDRTVEAFDSGVFTYVIAVGSALNLQAVANAGIGVQSDAPYWVATDATGLNDAFDEIINGIRSCVFDLNGEVVESKTAECSVTITEGTDVTDVPMDATNGWSLNNPSQIVLKGSACERIQTGDVTARVSCPCDAVVKID